MENTLGQDIQKNNLPEIIKSKLNCSEELAKKVSDAMIWLHMTDAKEPFVSFESGKMIDSFCDLLQKRLQYKTGERDMVFLQHIFEIVNSDGTEETKTVTLVAYGSENGYSAMAKTVGLPAAMGAELIMRGTLRKPGVLAPMAKEIYEPILRKLQQNSIKLEEFSNKI